MLHRMLALSMLSECSGDDLWSVEYCRQRGVPEAWIEELTDGFESNFAIESRTIYVENRRVNQYEGIRDVDLACKLGEYLGVDTSGLLARHLHRRQFVAAVREAVEEG
jgi:hypothetical protein